jgi:hypothetical protein
MKWSSFVLGYHGCDETVGERVLSGQTELRESTNDYDWLGRGIYFWEGSSQRALEWAHLVKANPKMSRSKITQPFVVGAIINLGNCLDLVESESIQLVQEAHEKLLQVLAIAGAVPPQNKMLPGGVNLLKLDCAVINAIHSFREEEGKAPFDSVRAAIVEGPQLYPASNFHTSTHLQLCVRNPKRITGYFRPKALSI